MASKKPNQRFGSLKNTTKDRKYRFYAKSENGGLSKSQVSQKYNAGTLGSQKLVRGHKVAPEHASEYTADLVKFHRTGYNPVNVPALTDDQRETLEILIERNYDHAFGNGNYNKNLVQANIEKMTDEQLVRGANATTAKLRSLAKAQKSTKRTGQFYVATMPNGVKYDANPFWYHAY
jgi:hypothetical protein